MDHRDDLHHNEFHDGDDFDHDGDREDDGSACHSSACHSSCKVERHPFADVSLEELLERVNGRAVVWAV